MSCLYVSLGRLVGQPHDTVRQAVCDFMAHNLETPYQGMRVSEWIRWQQNSSPAQYIAQMRRSSTWGGAMEIAMFTRLYRVDVHVYSADWRRKRLAEFVWDETRTACLQLHISWNGAHYEPLRRHALV